MAQYTETTWHAGALVQRIVYDDVANTATTFNGAGVQTAQRPLTAAELALFQAADADATATANAATLTTKATTALTGNTTYLAIASPTTAQAITQVAALTRQMDALIRLVTRVLDTTAGT